MSQSERCWSEWTQAHMELTALELQVLDWQLHRSTPVPAAWLSAVSALRDRADFLFERACEAGFTATGQAGLG